jgi:hypothetical protein
MKHAPPRCRIRDGEIYPPLPPAQLPLKRDYVAASDSEDSDDPDDSESDHGPDELPGVEPHGVVGYEDYSFDDDDDDSDDNEDPNEFADDEADEADQYYQW